MAKLHLQMLELAGDWLEVMSSSGGYSKETSSLSYKYSSVRKQGLNQTESVKQIGLEE